jgi:hypothetical protein
MIDTPRTDESIRTKTEDTMMLTVDYSSTSFVFMSVTDPAIDLHSSVHSRISVVLSLDVVNLSLVNDITSR